MDIHGCLGCKYCRNEGNYRCIQRDDMDIVNTELNEAEMVVLASPIYFWSITGQLQSVITRFYPKRKPFKAKKYALIMSAESSMAFDAAVTQYMDIVGYSGLENMGILRFSGWDQKTEANYKKAYNFGKNL
ncbi:MAG: NAD(P)H-dependent oxidoreductase, partial [Clostridia bacterium]|nr:NAD(P)H-dependent oxidoreductase [Clostridia bacterium]